MDTAKLVGQASRLSLTSPIRKSPERSAAASAGPAALRRFWHRSLSRNYADLTPSRRRGWRRRSGVASAPIFIPCLTKRGAPMFGMKCELVGHRSSCAAQPRRRTMFIAPRRAGSAVFFLAVARPGNRLTPGLQTVLGKGFQGLEFRRARFTTACRSRAKSL